MNIKHDCFVSAACYDSRCPNIAYDMIDDKWGGGIADDIGLEKIPCSKCEYHRGECKDCYLKGSPMCGDII